MTRPDTLDHLVGKKKPRIEKVPVVFDQDLAEEFEALRHDRDVAAILADGDPDDTDKALRRLDAEQAVTDLRARLEAEEAVVWFTFRSIGRPAYSALVEAHPPTAEQIAKGKAAKVDVPVNEDTFPQALVAACLVSPPLTADQVGALWSDPDWNNAELLELYFASTRVNNTRRTVDLGKDSRPTPSSATRSPTA